MVDPARLRRLLDRIGVELSHLRRLAGRADLAGDADRLAGVKYRFIVAIEAAIDAGEHVIASEALRAPESFADVFSVLGEAGLLPADLVPALERMARFRNLLVHGYADVDDGRVLEILRCRLDDLEAFRREVARLVIEPRHGAGGDGAG